MSDNLDLHELQEEKRVRISAMWGGLVAAGLAICFVVVTAMWFDGKLPAAFGVATAPSNPAANESTTAPAAPAPAGTVGQSPATTPAQRSQ